MRPSPRSESAAAEAPATRHGTLRGALAVAGFLTLTVLVFAPSAIYYGNVLEFPTPLVEMLPLFVGAALLGTVVLTGALMALPRGRARDIGVTVLFTLGFLAWFQGNVLVWPYGVLDGRAIDWAAHWRRELIDAAVWGLVLAAAAFAFRFVSRIAAAASVVLILIQVLGISVQAARRLDRWIDHVKFDDSARFSFSPDRNVVILVLDTFQSDLFQELLDDDPGLAEHFRGFTFYRNAVGGFPSTAASIPLILTGRHYDNAVPFAEFVKSTFSTASLPQALKAANFHVYYNAPYFWPGLYADETIASNVRTKTFALYEPIAWRRGKRLLSFGLFRSVPQTGKQLMDTTTGVAAPLTDAGPWHGDAPFFSELAARASVTMTTPTFKYYHLWGLHPPLTYDEQLRPQRRPFTRDNAKRQGAGLLRMLDTFLATFRDRGIYDKTMLLVVGDHGTSFDPRLVRVDDQVRTRPGAIPAATENSFGLPLVLLKPIGAVGPMAVSDVPVSLADIPLTVTSALGVPASFPGASMLNPGPADRHRRVLKYNPDALRLTDRYFPPLTEYDVSGFSWLDESWRQTGREFVRGTTRSLRVDYAYRWGQSLRFGLDGNTTPYQAGGWAAPEAGWNWTQGRSARLRFMTQAARSDLVFRAQVVPALPGGLQRQRAGLYVNDRLVADWSVTSAGEYSAIIPRALVPGGELELVVSLPDAVAPYSVSRDLRDERVLALAIVRAVLEEAKPSDARAPVEGASAIPLGTIIRLGSDSNGSRYLAGGWSAPEPGHNWTSASTAVLRFRTPTPTIDLVFALSATPFVVKGRLDRQRVGVSINKEKLGEWAVSKTAVYGVRIPKEQLASPITEIELELLDATVPRRLDPALMDDRQLGLSVHSIMADHDVRAGTPVFPTGDTIVLTREDPTAGSPRKRPHSIHSRP